MLRANSGFPSLSQSRTWATTSTESGRPSGSDLREVPPVPGVRWGIPQFAFTQSKNYEDTEYFTHTSARTMRHSNRIDKFDVCLIQ